MLDKIRIVLINTSHPGNIGATARALKNMGLFKLYLVAPKTFPHDEAVWRASHAVDILEHATVTETLDQAIDDCGLVVGTSARDRRIPWPTVNPRQFADIAYKEKTAEKDIALLFGREDRGLTNNELQLCHYHVHIPANPDYPSLNLATAVQVLCYELRMRVVEQQGVDGAAVSGDDAGWDIERASVADVERFYTHLEQTLIDLEFLDPNNPKQLMSRLRRLYNRVHFDQMELNILRGILTATNKVCSNK